MSEQAHSTRLNWRIISWLRGLAAFYVVINHSRGALFSDSMMYAQHVNPKENWHWWEWLQMTIMNHTGLGSEFVILFFLLSGFSIAHSLRNDTGNFSFYKRRLVRLYPPYLLGILWSFVVIFLVWAFVPYVYYNEAEGFISIKEVFEKISYFPTLLSNLFYMPKDNHLTHQYWSLPFEVIFYLLAPWMVRKFRFFGTAMLFLYIAGWLIYGKAYHNPDHTNTLFQFSIEYGIYFIVGIMFYKYKDKLIKSFKLSKPVAVISILALFEVMVLSKGYMFGGEHNKFTGIMTVAFTYLLLFSALKYSFRIKWLEKIGDYSYTLYVTHWATIFGVKIIAVKLGFNYYYIHNLYFWYIGIPICLVTSYVLYLLVEKPSNQLVEKLRKQPDNPINPAAMPARRTKVAQ
jgi:peptidoglycan/LPS O-acetylase OafA/YrhL